MRVIDLNAIHKGYLAWCLTGSPRFRKDKDLENFLKESYDSYMETKKSERGFLTYIRKLGKKIFKDFNVLKYE